MDFFILANDGTDDAAEARRLKARPDHARRIKDCIQSGEFVSGGAILDDAGKMIGSALFMRFNSRKALDHWISTDAYTSAGVWQDISIREIALVPST